MRTWILFLAFLLSSAVATPYALSTTAANSLKDCATAYAGLVDVKHRPEGPRLYLRAPKNGLRDFDRIDELKVGQYNVENLYNYQGKWEYDAKGNWVQTAPAQPKPVERWKKMKEVIERSDDDIMVWEEVEDFTAAKDFVDTYLGGRYRIALIDGNDERGIDVAVLIKNDLPFDMEVLSHKEVLNSRKSSKVFSRDLPVVVFRKAGAAETDKPLMYISGAHYKSQRDSPGDPLSVKKRTEQVSKAAQILSGFEKQYPTTPGFHIGDMNADVRTATEFQSLWDMGYKDSFDLAPNPLPKDERKTHSYFPRGGTPKHSQLDAILVNKAGADADIVKNAEIIPYKNSDGTDMPLPKTYDERSQQGSDHRKLRSILSFKKIREIWARP